MGKAAAWCWGKRGVETQAKAGELTVGSAVIDQLELRGGRVVTGDALYAQRKLSCQVVEQGGDYLWAVKRNQPTLYQDVSLLFTHPPWGEEEATAGQEGRHGDRWELRELRSSTALNDYLDWPCVQQVCSVERWVTRRGAARRERAYAITSLSPAQAGPQALLNLWRGHWKIENQLHWVRDVSMGEDDSQVRTGSAPQVMAALRNVALNLLRWSGASNIAAARRHYGWKPVEALALIGLPPS